MPTTTTPPTWFRIVAVLLVLWGLMGVGACVQQLRLGAEAMGPASAYDRALYASLPAWYNGIYAVAVGAGLLGSLALIARRRIAVTLYLVSLVAVVVQFGWLFAATDIVAVRGAGTVVPFPLFIAGVAAFQLWLARRAAARGWIA
jgi:hypothetical protein